MDILEPNRQSTLPHVTELMDSIQDIIDKYPNQGADMTEMIHEISETVHTFIGDDLEEDIEEEEVGGAIREFIANGDKGGVELAEKLQEVTGTLQEFIGNDHEEDVEEEELGEVIRPVSIKATKGDMMEILYAPELPIPPEIEDIEEVIQEAVNRDPRGTLSWLTHRAHLLSRLRDSLGEYKQSHSKLSDAYNAWVDIKNIYTFEE